MLAQQGERLEEVFFLVEHRSEGLHGEGWDDCLFVVSQMAIELIVVFFSC